MLTPVLSGYPFHEGSGSSDLVPFPYEVALSGEGFNVDRTYPTPHKHEPLPLLRDQADSTDQPGERSINRQSLWRSSSFSWHAGAGQLHLDRQGSSPYRFRESRGVDPWTKWQLSLLPDTTLTRASTETFQTTVIAAGNLLHFAGDTVAKSADGTTFTALTGTPAADFLSAATDGTNVYATDAAAVYHFAGSASAIGTAWAVAGVTTLSYAKGYLLAFDDHEIYTIDNTGTKSTAIFSHNFGDFEWVGAAEHSNYIYAAGYSGVKSEIYRIGVDESTGALGTGIYAGGLPDGERVHAIGSYLDFILLGTSKGVRFATPGEGGGLVIGAYIQTPEPVLTFEGQESYVYFGWSDFDGSHSGLGRLDLRTINDDAPAFASDLMAATQGEVRSAVTFDDRQYFTVAGVGLYRQSDDLVSEGYLQSGRISYDLSDEKIAMFVDVKHDALDGEIDVHMSTPTSDSTYIGSSIAQGTAGHRLSALQRRGEWLDLRFTLRDGDGSGPILTRYTLLSNPTTDPGTVIYAPLIIADDERANGVDVQRDTGELVDFLKGLHDSGNLFTYQEGNQSHTVVMRAYEWRPLSRMVDDPRRVMYNGTFLAVLLTV